MPLLDDKSIARELLKLPGWEVSDQVLQKRFEFDGFPEAITFAVRVAFVAERRNHHPDLLIQYNKVGFSVTTHDAGGITDKDFALAAEVEQSCAQGAHATSGSTAGS